MTTWLDGIDRSWLKAIRAEQERVAKAVAASIFEDFRDSFRTELRVLDNMVGWKSLAQLPQDSDDFDVFETLLQKKVYADALGALRCYSDWVAATTGRCKISPLDQITLFGLGSI